MTTQDKIKALEKEIRTIARNRAISGLQRSKLIDKLEKEINKIKEEECK